MPKIGDKIIRRVNLEVKLACLELISQFKSFDPSEAFIISSDPRGGSTWLAELLNKIPKTAMIWEPLNIAEVKEFKKLEFGIRQFIPHDFNWVGAQMNFEKVFKGKIINEFTTQFLTVSEYARAKHILAKFCRANALLPWLIEHFEFKYQPILLIRHPFSVVSSQLNHRGWKSRQHHFQKQKGPFSDFYNQHEKFLTTLKSNEEFLVAQWCMSNLPTLRNLQNNKGWVTLFYENLLTDTKTELKRVESRWQLKFPVSLYENHTSASKTSVNFDRNISNQLNKWQTYFESDQIMKLISVLDYFDCEFYNGDIMPLKQFS